jgi:Rrf2 family transcriptional regulator, iron-sulfur cluster assembly transcription factor
MLSQTAEYALRAVLYLARADRPVAADQIAEALGAPRNYLSKTLHALAKAGIVKGLRGPNGGFRLAVPAQDLTLARVIDAFDGAEKTSMCLLGGVPCSGATPCDAHHRWSAIAQSARGPLATTTVAELLGLGQAVAVA